ncbi:MAG TPA: TolC family protein [Leptospiraceae bacterium]|nr:TolC family protein [Leptospirales bacterium]HMU84735.1 TolC family protein [Leptospiraceae bacterium]HMX55159.1 TolC family protein [Leptospiraceae bacterium]HMY46483.1 TolC family protein [Leptospiraceae bacterium]HMZ36586.1 TolC family protein [Leptospiraceae bacterium]
MKSLILCAALWFAANLYASPLEEIIDQHPLVQSQSATAGASRHAARSTMFGYPDPEIEISRSRGREDMIQALPDQMVDRKKITGSEFEVRQPIPFPGKGTVESLRLGAKADEETLRIRLIKNRMAREFLMLRTRERLIQARIKLNSQTQERLRTLETLARIRYETGKTPLVDLSMVHVRESEAALAVNQAQSEYASVHRAVEYYTTSSGETHNMSDDQVDSELAELETRVRNLAAKFEEHSLEMKMAESQIKQGDLDDTRAWMNYLPDFEVFAGYGKENKSSAGLRDWTSEKFYKAGVTIRVPLWTAFTNHWNILEKSGNLEAARLRLADARLKAKTDLQASLDRMDGIKKGLRLHDQSLIPGAMNAHEAARISYANGKADFSIVIQSLQVHFDHELSRLEHELEFTAELLKAAESLDAFFPGKDK